MKEMEKRFAAVLSRCPVFCGGLAVPPSIAAADQTPALDTRICQAAPENSIRLRNQQEEEKYRRAEQEDRNIQQQMEAKGLKSQAQDKHRKRELHTKATLSESQTGVEKMQREMNVKEQTAGQNAFFNQHLVRISQPAAQVSPNRKRECEERRLP